MKKHIQLIYLVLVVVLIFFNACKSHRNIDKDHVIKKAVPKYTKPPSSNLDTLFITEPSAVFYYPDSIQFEQIKTSTAPSVFQSQTHEFHFQARNARIVIKRDWPKLKVVENQNCRFIKFTMKGLSTKIIDLNNFNDFSGIVLFGEKKQPRQIDMMNIETELYYYYKN